LPRKTIDVTRWLQADGLADDAIKLDIEQGDSRSSPVRTSRHSLQEGQGTHVLTPYFTNLDGATLSDLDNRIFFGEGLILRFKFPEANIGIGQAEVEEGAGGAIHAGDIVFMANLGGEENSPILTPQAAKWLVEQEIKLVGFDEAFQVDVADRYETHKVFLDAGIPIIRNLTNLDSPVGLRVAVMALPLAVSKSASSPCRVLILD